MSRESLAFETSAVMALIKSGNDGNFISVNAVGTVGWLGSTKLGRLLQSKPYVV